MLARSMVLALALLPPNAIPSPRPASFGAPTICFPLEVAGAPSLPWGDEGAFSTASDYDRRRAPADAIRVLDATSDPLAHMEALRRTAIYVAMRKGEASNVDALAFELLAKLRGRVLAAELPADGAPARSASERGLAWFDLGYAQATLVHCGWERDARGTEALERAARLRPDDGAVQLGAALANWGENGWRAHLERAMALARESGGALRENVLRTAGRILGASDEAELARIVSTLER